MSHSDLERAWAGIEAIVTPKARKSERTRKAILDGALELLWTQPFREIKVADLMAIAGVGRSAFYRYFDDLYALMDTLLKGLEADIFEAAGPWLTCDGEPKRLLRQSLSGLVRVCFERGPLLRAVADASTTDERLERSWAAFLDKFDEAVTGRIEQQQALGLIEAFDARSIAVALNRLDASMLIHSFGRHPRRNPEMVLEALTRIWTSTLYESKSMTNDGEP